MNPAQMSPDDYREAIAAMMQAFVSAFMGGAADRPPADPELDYTVPEYRLRFAPDVSENTIRDWCAKGIVPQTRKDGEFVPGAYKDSLGRWRITREGIAERQRRDRIAGVDPDRPGRADAEHVHGSPREDMSSPLEVTSVPPHRNGVRTAKPAVYGSPSTSARRRHPHKDADLNSIGAGWRAARGVRPNAPST